MFRPLMLAIFRLYMDLSSSYVRDTTCGVFLFYVWGKWFVWDRDLACVSGGCVVWNVLSTPCVLNLHFVPLTYILGTKSDDDQCTESKHVA